MVIFIGWGRHQAQWQAHKIKKHKWDPNFCLMFKHLPKISQVICNLLTVSITKQNIVGLLGMQFGGFGKMINHSPRLVIVRSTEKERREGIKE